MREATSVYAERRSTVLKLIHPGILVLPAAEVVIRNQDVEYEYRQNSDFYYLTGFCEPESVLVLDSTRPEAFTLFLRPRDPAKEQWDGARVGVEGATKGYGADRALPIQEMAQELPKLLCGVERVFYGLGKGDAFDALFFQAFRAARGLARGHGIFPTQLIDSDVVLHTERLIKSHGELVLMAKAAEISASAHLEAMARTASGQYEYEVEARLMQAFRSHGCERAAYPAIVGGGKNATVLHYRANDQQLNDGDLLLIDAGCEYGYYASDITRTFPVSGRFTDAQKAIYEIVLEAQLASIGRVRAGVTLPDVHRASVEVICQGLCRLGILKGTPEEEAEKESYREFFMHRTSHYLGMDVHDVGPHYLDGKVRPLAAGTVITVEPGLYFADTANAPEQYRGIGIRIEDDVVVESTGHGVLSSGAPKHVDAVEAACRG